MNPLSLFTGPLWKLGTIGAGLVCIILTGLLVHCTLENHKLIKQETELNQRIEDPKTGYIAQLVTATNNVAVYKAALDRQNLAYKNLSETDAQKLAATQKQLDAAEASTKQMTEKLNKFLATKPQGATLDAQIRDIDARALSELVQ